MQRKRPKSLEAPVYQKLRQLELYAYVRGDARITSYYKDKLGLTVHPNKKYIQHYSKGVELLGQKLRFNRILPSDRIYHNITWYIDRTIGKASVKTKYVFVYKDKILSSVNSYLGMLRQMNAFKLRRKICKQIETSTLGRVFEISPDFTKITIKKQYSTKTYYKQQYKLLKKQLKP